MGPSEMEVAWVSDFVARMIFKQGAGAEPETIRLLALSLFPSLKGMDPKLAAEQQLAVGDPHRHKTEAPARSKLVLIADDYGDTASMMAEVIGQADAYEGLAAKDGEEALALAMTRQPDAVVLDIDMPRVGGIAAARALRKAHPLNPPLLIAMSTANGIDQARQSGLFNRVLKKPVDFRLLFELLNQIH